MKSSTSSIGKQAEAAVAKRLKEQGYQILAQNWRTRLCEIDIVAQKGHTVYFVEVKYRATADYGSGIDYITKAKLKQIQFAAENWLSQSDWSGDSQLLVAEVSGANFDNIDIVEL